MPKVKDETRYKRKMLGNYPLWSESYEPGLGSGTGYPDVQLLSPRKVLLPIELKVGLIINDRVFPREVRRDQVVWHHNFQRHGGIAVIAIGVETEKGSNIWDSYVVPGNLATEWASGYAVSDCFRVIGTVGDGLVELVQHFLGESTPMDLASPTGSII